MRTGVLRTHQELLNPRAACLQTMPERRLSQGLWRLQRKRGERQRVHAIHIDRKQHLELAWKRQKMEEALLKAEAKACPSECITEVRSLAHLETLVDAAGSSIVCIYYYSRSCGICKEVLRQYAALCKEASGQRAGVRFLKHNICDEFDDWSDVARLYRIKAVPAFVFFVGGAQMRKVSMVDSRQQPEAIQRIMGWQRGRVADVLRQVLFHAAPSARR